MTLHHLDPAATLPLRNPDLSDPSLMVRRAWWLVLANFLLPGTAQVLAGNRRFGRFMLRVWLGCLLAVLAILLMAWLWRAPLLFLFSTSVGIVALVSALFALAALCCVSTLDALRLARIIRVDALARPLIAIIAVVCAFVPLAATAMVSSNANRVAGTVRTIFGGPSAGWQLPADGQYNILLLGGDRGADREGLRPDSISVMSFNVWSGRLTTIGVPRAMESFPFSEDSPMRERYPGLYEGCEVDVCYLNSVYTEANQSAADLYPDAEDRGSDPGIEATKDAVEGITGLTIHYYALVDMSGFANLIDALGGVDINVTERVGIGINDDGSEGWQPATEWIEPGMQHMDGSTALWYARSRYETTDFARMQRQRELQAAMIARMTPGNLAMRMGPVAEAIEQVVETDMPEGISGIMADLMLKSRSTNNSQLGLVPPLVDQSEPDVERIHELVREAIATEPEPSPTEPAAESACSAESACPETENRRPSPRSRDLSAPILAPPGRRL